MIFDLIPISLNEWSHLAAVFGKEETRMYLNGKLVATCPPTRITSRAFKVCDRESWGETSDTILQREDSICEDFKGEAYDGALEPNSRLKMDESTVYQFHSE